MKNCNDNYPVLTLVCKDKPKQAFDESHPCFYCPGLNRMPLTPVCLVPFCMRDEFFEVLTKRSNPF